MALSDLLKYKRLVLGAVLVGSLGACSAFKGCGSESDGIEYKTTETNVDVPYLNGQVYAGTLPKEATRCARELERLGYNSKDSKTWKDSLDYTLSPNHVLIEGNLDGKAKLAPQLTRPGTETETAPRTAEPTTIPRTRREAPANEEDSFED